MPVLEGPTQAVHLVTGAGSPQRTDRLWGLAGTDLGIAFTDAEGTTFMAFGDTVACDNSASDWRSNTLVKSYNTDYSDGLQIWEALTRNGFASSGKAVEFIPSNFKIEGVEHTVIPTAGIAIGDTLYIDYMSVRKWGSPGQWTTNYAATMESQDGGQTWRRVNNSIRVNTDNLPNEIAQQIGRTGFESWPGNARLQMASLIHGDDGYVYRFSTENGRFGAAYLSRTKAEDFPRESTFEFWDGSGWARTAIAARRVIDEPVSELSVAWNDHLNKYVALYLAEGTGMVMRTADELTGPWSEQTVLVGVNTVPDLYGGFILPYNNGKDFYWVATTWSDYNVMLMKTDLDALRVSRASATSDGLTVVGEIDYSELRTPEDAGVEPLASENSESESEDALVE